MSVTKNRKVKTRRAIRTRTKIRSGKSFAPRLSVYRSNTHMSFQIIDDKNGKTIAAAHTKELSSQKKMTRMEKARELGVMIAKRAKEKKIKTVIFDRGSYAYHGLVKTAAEGAREEGLQF